MKKRLMLLIFALILIPLMCTIAISFHGVNVSAYDMNIVSVDGVVSLIDGNFFGTNVTDEADGFEFLNTISSEYGFEDSNLEFEFETSINTTDGNVLRFNQMKDGVQVYGRSLSVSVDENGRVLSVSGNYKKSQAVVTSIDLEVFVEEFKSKYGVFDVYDAYKAIYNNNNFDDECVVINCLFDGLVRDIVVRCCDFEFLQVANASANINNLTSYTKIGSHDALMEDSNGNMVSVKVETYKSLFGQTYNLLCDSSRNIYMAVMAPGKTINSSNFFEYAEESLSDPMVIEAYKNLCFCYDYYANASNFGTSINGLKNEAGKEIDLIAVVHAVERFGQSYDNAGYSILNAHSTYAYFLFGDGGTNARDYATSLDVVAHEYQHGVTTSIRSLEYLNESGAINEAYSDIFGAIIEGHDMSSDEFWLMGEDITVSSIAFRDMKNPSNPLLDSEYPDSVANMYNLCHDSNCSHKTCDCGGVHFNSVILTHAAYKMYESNTSFFTPFRLGELWYNTLTKLTKTATFSEFRVQMQSVATALGYPNSVLEAIENAFIEVGIILPDEVLTAEFYFSEQDANLGVKPIEVITSDTLGEIVLPASKQAPEGFVHYYWTNGEDIYMPGDNYLIDGKKVKLWGVFVEASKISEAGIVLKGNIGVSGKEVGEFGSVSNPFKIHSPAEFLYLGYLVNSSATNALYRDKYYSVKADLYLNNVEYTPLGASETLFFAGSFGGGNHTVFELNLSKNNIEVAGLFGFNHGSIYNLAIGIGETTVNSGVAGSIVGVNYGNISTCYSMLSISGTGVVGGLAGITYANAGNSIVNSYSEANVTGSIAGGIVGKAINEKNSNYSKYFSAYIGNVYSTGDITGDIVGGICGVSNGYYFVNPIVLGNVQAKNNSSIIGGIVGILTDVPFESGETANSEIYAGIMSGKIVAQLGSNGAQAGTLVGKIECMTPYLRLNIENNTAKLQEVDEFVGNYDLLDQNIKSSIIMNKNKLSDDGAFDGDFDFDNLTFYNDISRWSITRGVALYNLESVWRIVEAEKMPRILTYDFWINNYADNFSGGNGVDDPFKISSAEELSRLAYLVMNQQSFYYGWDAYSYADASYELTRDIDLTGKIWVGIGMSIYAYDESDNVDEFVYVPFTGMFDGNGHTISNMNSLPVYSCSDYLDDFGRYYVGEYNSGLFGLVSSSYYSPAIIKDFSMRNVTVSGTFASPVASQVIGSTQFSGIKIHSGTISGSSIAGGIVGLVGATESGNEINVVVSECMNNAIMSSRRMGGIVGSVMNNAFTGYGSIFARNTSIKIYNSIFRGDMYAFNDDLVNNSSYYSTFAGGIIGVADAKNVELYNNIYLGNIFMYTNGYAGKLVGSTGYRNEVTSAETNIISSHNKLSGEIKSLYDTTSSAIGNYIGNVLFNTNTVVSILDNSSISDDQMNSIGQVDGNNQNTLESIYSSTGFDFYTYSYFSTESGNFNNSYPWIDTSSMVVTISFVGNNGEVLCQPLKMPYGAKLTQSDLPSIQPEDFETAGYTYEFVGWDIDFDKVNDEDTYISAKYNATKRSYNVTYKLSDGTVVKVVNVNYGDKIDMEVVAPQKKSSFFFTYKFSHWQFESDVVTENMVGIAVYKTVVGQNLLIVVLAIMVAIVVGSVITREVQKRKS